MNEIIKGVNALATEELIRANKEHPLFHSDHEALAVIMEEVSECAEEAERLEIMIESFKDAVFTGRDDTTKKARAQGLRKRAVMCAREAIQTVAMCDKYFMGKECKE